MKLLIRLQNSKRKKTRQMSLWRKRKKSLKRRQKLRRKRQKLKSKLTSLLTKQKIAKYRQLTLEENAVFLLMWLCNTSNR